MKDLIFKRDVVLFYFFAGIHKDDKQKVRQVMHQFLPDLYFTPRGNQPSDDEDDEEDGK